MKIRSGRQRGSARIKAAYARYTGIRRARIPYERAKKLPGIAGKILNPNNALNRERPINKPQSPRKIAAPMAMARNLKFESLENLDFISVREGILDQRPKPVPVDCLILIYEFREKNPLCKTRNPPLHYRHISGAV